MAEKLIGKRVQFDSEDWAAINMLAKDRVATFQELAEEAFRDLLKKHNRPVGLKAALRQSLGGNANVVPLKRRRSRKRT
jgi:uncharacterized protein with von Willebrand factor type A (vWA) domain